jgi:hypothetical protein
MMSEKRRDDTTTARTKETQDTLDAVRDNTVRVVDEFAKVQPQYSQSLSNLQLDYMQTYKNMIQTAFATQKQFASSLNMPIPSVVADVVAKQSTELTNNMVRSIGTTNQLAINALDAARENTKIYSKTVDAISDYNTNLLRAWTTFWTNQQQQFFRA